MARPSKPLAVRFAYRKDDGALAFVGATQEVVFTEHANAIERVLRHCNGHATLEEIRKQSGVEQDVFDAVLRVAFSERLIVDSRELSLEFHQASVFPAPYGVEYDPRLVRRLLKQDRAVTLPGQEVASIDEAQVILRESPVARTIMSRKSSRSFKSLLVPLPSLLALLRCMYWTGSGPASTPSAGGLYPLQIHLATADPAQSKDPLLLRYDPTSGTLYQVHRQFSPSQLSLTLDLPQAPNGWVVFIVGELTRDIAKYGNRAYRLIHLDAGHAAQNAYLFAVEQGLGIREYAGFQDQIVADLLRLDYPNEAVLITLIVGFEDINQPAQFTTDRLEYLHQLKKKLVGKGKPVEWVELVSFGTPPYELQRIVAVASYRDPTDRETTSDMIHRLCQGVATSAIEAGVKAIAEAFERHTSGRTRWDRFASAEDLSREGASWTDPRLYTPYLPDQYAGPLRHLTPFDPAQPIQWVQGSRMATHGPVYVPIEHVFYPVLHKEIGRRTCYEATSSGVAAFVDADTAAQRALFELIERDAICATWYGQRPAQAIPYEFLDQDTLLRAERWIHLGWTVKHLDITTDSVPIVLCVISSKTRRPHFVAGAAAANTHREAAQKAMDEAELMLTARRTTRRRKTNPSRVRSPLDHGLLFFEPEMLKHVAWLVDAPFGEPVVHEHPNPVVLYDPVRIDLVPESARQPFSVVRIISDRLLPITFGYGTEHSCHPRLKMLGLEWRLSYPSMPHFFA